MFLKAELLRLEVGRRHQHGRVDRPGFQSGEPGAGRPDDDDVVVAFLEAVGDQHAIEVDAIDVAQAADGDRLAP